MNTLLYVPHCCHVCFTGSHLHLFADTALPTECPLPLYLALLSSTHTDTESQPGGLPVCWTPELTHQESPRKTPVTHVLCDLIKVGLNRE